MDRRSVIRLGAGAVMAVPFGVARVLTERELAPIVPLKVHDVLTAKWMAQLVERVNELSAQR